MILVGNALKVLRTLKGESVQTCVTSPPYWGLRDYGLPPTTWGDSNCDHEFGDELGRKRSSADTAAGLQCTPRPGNEYDVSHGNVCRHCGAWRGQLGLEPTPQLFVQHLVELFEEVHRVLKPDGTLWLNLGDSYSGVGAQTGGTNGKEHGRRAERMFKPNISWRGIKPKDLIGIPWRVAFALQDAGWYLRSDIIWHKPNPMPESVRDRPTKAHEYLFLFAKQPRYYYDADAIREPAIDPPGYSRGGSLAHFEDGPHGKISALSHRGSDIAKSSGYRNKRDVWTIATRPFKGAHFATFPPKLIEPCILAGSRPGDVVLDPFAGAGTTGLVAQQYSRRFVGIELNPGYAEMAEERLAAA